MSESKIGIIIPTIRNLDFLEKWKNEFINCVGIIIEDHQIQEIETPSKYFAQTFHYTWADIKKTLDKNEWIIPRKNAGIRSFGFLMAYRLGLDYIITLDDDCFPIKNNSSSFVQNHLENLSLKAPKKWFPSYPYKNFCFTRGFPYLIRDKKEVVMSHGLWTNILDFDAPNQLLNQKLTINEHFPLLEFIPEKYYFPMCSMNLAFKTSISPLLYFPLMGSDPNGKPWGFDRFDDIWAGIFAKKIIDHLNMAVVNGCPFVEHKKASDVFQNLKKEASGIEINENIFEIVDKVKLSSKTPKDCYLELARKIDFPKSEYFETLRQAMIIWAKLF